jgi:hypothetical protein
MARLMEIHRQHPGGSKGVHNFEGDGQGWVMFEGVVKVSSFVTLKCVALVKPLGPFCSLHLLMCCMLLDPSAYV